MNKNRSENQPVRASAQLAQAARATQRDLARHPLHAAATVTFPDGAFPTPLARSSAFAALLADLQVLPGVSHAALTQTAPLYKVPGYGDWEIPDGRSVEVYRHWGAGDVPGA